MQMKKVLSILLVAVMLISVIPFTAYAADTTTVTITRSDLPADPWRSFTVTRNGVSVTVAAGLITNDDDDYCLEGGGSFTTSSGKFTSIVVTAEMSNASGTGWSGNSTTKTWSGTPASTVSFSKTFDNWSQIVCTIETTPAHTHNFSYTADGATITATCGEGCDITTGLTLSISAPTGDLVADGTKTFPATLSTGYNTTAFPEGSISDISYTKDGQPYNGTPTEAGAYTASVTVGTATASVSYTVATPTYTITWMRDANTLIDETQVEEGATPTHAAPADYEDADYTYTFAGWTPEVVAATADATYTATFSATPKAHNNVNLTLGEDITSNYYVDYTKYEGAAKIVYTYNGVNEREAKEEVTEEVDLNNIPAAMLSGDKLMLTVSQAPAQMAEPVEIQILGANDQVIATLDFSAKAYCDKVLGMTDDDLANYTDKVAQFKTLCHTLLAYGQAAQGVFADYDTTNTKVYCTNDAVNAQIAAVSNETVTPDYSVDNSGMIKFTSVSFVCTKDARLRFYLDTSGATYTPAAPTSNIGNASVKYTMNGNTKQYFVEVSNIKAAYFGDKITVNYGGSTIEFSVLDFAAIVLANSTASEPLQHFAQTLVVYNTNALAFFSN